MFADVVESVEKSPVTKMGNYYYFIHPLSNGIPAVPPRFLDEISSEILKSKKDFDKIVTVEAMGIPLATAIALRSGIPFNVIRKRKLDLPGEISVEQQTGYSTSTLYINGIHKGEKILFVDDVLSTGSTLRSSVKAIQKLGADVREVWIIFDRCENKEEIEKEINTKINTILKIRVDKNGVRVVRQ